MNTKEKADALVDKFKIEITGNKHLVNILALDYAIISVERTIEVLSKMDNEIYNIEPYITEQTELLNELKSRI